ncbi:putative aminotransferase class-III [Sphingobacterium faecium NBRC 15299]|uniref:L-lysine 6-transaminase n=1 Tax=Sphingobacterium faecium TaxID=34087 RepID=UPI000D3CE1F2|nr:L-lysine 6-transaminase [Sphingobacterium faecium]PTX10727.1 L-lysine 6-transaminase precursor [Sphingobacterium faecium]GEM62606.1 putative aminotransferase class-III [Sphingobacterium faecium NBRC 15299]
MSTVHEILSKHLLADGFPIVMDMEKSHGSYLVDQNGDEYLDLFSMFASVAIGYNHPHLLAQKEFLGKMAINKPALSDIYPKEFADFMEVFERVAMPKELQYCFFIAGGTLAVENTLKAAFDWKTRLNLAQGIEKEASQVIHFKEAFHGRSGYTLSLTNTKDPRKYMYFPKFNWPRITNPKLTFPVTETVLQGVIEKEKMAIREIRNALAQHPNDIACIIIEPIQAEGGDNHFRKEFFQSLRDICDEHDILLIFDEVQTGIGLTGSMWAYQHIGVVPDLVAFGKKTQVCGLLANKDKFDRVEKHVFQESSRINSTFGGDFTDMMRFKLILEVIEQENLIELITQKGAYFMQQLETLAIHHPQISNIRGQGLFIAFDLENEQVRDQFIKDAFAEKLILLGCGRLSIRFRPHLNILMEEIDAAIAIMNRIL